IIRMVRLFGWRFIVLIIGERSLLMPAYYNRSATGTVRGAPATRGWINRPIDPAPGRWRSRRRAACLTPLPFQSPYYGPIIASIPLAAAGGRPFPVGRPAALMRCGFPHTY